MAIYYDLPLISGMILGIILTTVLLKITETPNASLKNASLLIGGNMLFILIFVYFLPNTPFLFLGVYVAVYFLIKALFGVPNRVAMVFSIINLTFGFVNGFVLGPPLAEIITGFLY
tara:strand:- start:1199 stop:1546 length:348 start_codon:yes stop_codon:yes gene_type:complete